MKPPSRRRPVPNAVAAKARRGFCLGWGQLTNPKNFVIPQSLAEQTRHTIFEPRLRVGHRDWFFNPSALSTLEREIDRLYCFRDFARTLTYASIHKEVLAAVQRGVLARLAKAQIEGDSAFDEILENLERLRLRYESLFVLDGIELDGVEELRLGPVTIAKFGEEEEKAFILESGGEKEQAERRAFTRRTFRDRTCARSVAFGDAETAFERSRVSSQMALNILRFVVCLVSPEAIPQNYYKINLRESSVIGKDASLSIGRAEDQQIIRWGRGVGRLDNLKVTEEFVQNLRGRCFLDLLGSLLEDSTVFDLDAAIRNALYWIGEAQHDSDATTAFVKYWIGLEAISTGDRADIGERVARTVAVLLAFAGYKFIIPAQMAATRNDVKRLYDRRCDIVHRGMIDRVNPADLRGSCESAARALLCTLALRADGVTERGKLQSEISRLYALGMKEA